jgi:hypothetical protein
MNLKIVLGGAAAAAAAAALTSVAIAQNYQGSPDNSPLGSTVGRTGPSGQQNYNAPATPPMAAPPNQGAAPSPGYSGTYRGYTNAPGAPAENEEGPGAAAPGGMAGERG